MTIVSNWFTFSVIAMLCYATVVLLLKKLTYAASTSVMLLYMFSTMAGLFLAQNLTQGNSLRIGSQSLGFILLGGMLAAIGSMCEVESLRLAPNIGYATAIKSGQILVVTIIGYFIFKDQQLSWHGVLGVLLILSGVTLLALQK